MERTVLHCDCNAFFASVEAVLNPRLNGSAFAVCGDPELRHGIILAKNEAAKSFGVKTGEAIWQAKSKCPSLLLVKPTYGAYDEFSHRIFNIYCRYTDLVEPFGIDECWLDVTGSMHFFGTGKEIADELRRVVKHETGLTISAGVSFNKHFAKMGSDYKKPDATTVISRENFKEILYPMPVEDMFFVGNSTRMKLRGIGIYTIGELAGADIKVLEKTLGKNGRELYFVANGMDYSPVKSSEYKREYKSIGNGATFKHDLVRDDEIRTAVFMLCDKVAGRLRKHAVDCKTLGITIKGSDLKGIQRQMQLTKPTQLTSELVRVALEIISDNRTQNEALRAITVTAQELLPEKGTGEQISFFCMDECLKRDKEERLEATKDIIRGKYGTKSLISCSLINNDLGL